MKIKLINKQTNEEHICSKVVIDGFQYYITNQKVTGKIGYNSDTNQIEFFASHPKYDESGKRVIATNNPFINLPLIINIEETLAKDAYPDWYTEYDEGRAYIGYKKGYNKSQESHPFSEEDLIEFANFYFTKEFYSSIQNSKNTKELLQIWKEKRIKIIYYV